MLFCVITALAVALGAQSPPPDRVRAEQLARAGQTADAMELFEQIVEQNPGDVEARLWIARLDLRLGRTGAAERGFRAVVEEQPANVDARVGLGAALTRQGEWRAALEILQATEREAGENSDLFGALARAYRRAGNEQQALEYFRRAKTLAPADTDAVTGFEAVAQAYGHALAFEGFGEQLSTGTETGSGELRMRIRATRQLHVEGSARVQQRAGMADALGGGGILWRAGRQTQLGVRAIGGAGNTVLPTSDVSIDFVRYAGAFEVAASVRRMSFAGDNVVAASPIVAWDPGGRSRLDGRYTYSRSTFAATNETSGDHSVMLRETWRGWRRVALNLTYAYGIESFEDLTADRLGALDATTLAAGVRISTPSLTALTTTWEHQWRSNNTAIDRLTVSIVQSFP